MKLKFLLTIFFSICSLGFLRVYADQTTESTFRTSNFIVTPQEDGWYKVNSLRNDGIVALCRQMDSSAIHMKFFYKNAKDPHVVMRMCPSNVTDPFTGETSRYNIKISDVWMDSNFGNHYYCGYAEAYDNGDTTIVNRYGAKRILKDGYTIFYKNNVEKYFSDFQRQNIGGSTWWANENHRIDTDDIDYPLNQAIMSYAKKFGNGNQTDAIDYIRSNTFGRLQECVLKTDTRYGEIIKNKEHANEIINSDNQARNIYCYKDEWLYIFLDEYGKIGKYGSFVRRNGDRSNPYFVEHAKWQKPTDLRVEGNVATLMFDNGDYLKYSLLKNMTFEGILHYPSGHILKLYNNGYELIKDIEYPNKDPRGITGKNVNGLQSRLAIGEGYKYYTNQVLSKGACLGGNLCCGIIAYTDDISKLESKIPSEYVFTDNNEPAFYADKKWNTKEEYADFKVRWEKQWQENQNKALKEKELKEQKIINRYIAKYGKTNVNNVMNATIKIGMPFALLKACYNCEERSKSKGRTSYLVYVSYLEPSIEEDRLVYHHSFGVWKYIVSTSNGRVTSVLKY